MVLVVSEGLGGAGRLRSRLYALLEETSFRSGAAACAAALAVAAVAVTLAVILGGHRVPPPRAAHAGPVPSSPVLPARAYAASPAASVRPPSHPARKATPDADNAPGPATRQPVSSYPQVPARLPVAAEPAWPPWRWRPAGPLPAWVRPRPWDRHWPYPDHPWRHRDRRPAYYPD
jgi:hypothetical protein